MNVCRIVALLGFLLFLAGCTTVSPQKLGISQAQWQQYTPAQREQFIHDYQHVNAKNINKSSKPGDSVLAINISGGKALMPPFTELHAYQPLSLTIKDGECGQKITVSQADDPKQKSLLKVCYQDSVVYLDPSPYEAIKAKGSIQLPYMPMWKRGFTYPNVTSSGYVKLTDVNISIHELSTAN